MSTTLTTVRQLMTVIDTATNDISTTVQHLQHHLNKHALMTEDAQYFLDAINKSVATIKAGVAPRGVVPCNTNDY